MKITLVYISPNGTTRKTAEKLHTCFQKDNHVVELVDLGMPKYYNAPEQAIEAVFRAEIVGFGSPAYHMDMLAPMQRFIQIMDETDLLFRCKAFLFVNFGGITTGKAFINTAKALKKIGIPIIGGLKLYAPHFHHPNEKFPTEMTYDKIEEFCNSLKKRMFTIIPWKELKKEFSPEKTIVKAIYLLVHHIGKKRELPITILTDKCKICMKCIRECPVGAIAQNGSVKIDTEKCIHCYHCVAACPFDAIDCPIEKIDKMIAVNKKIIGTETPTNKILM